MLTKRIIPCLDVKNGKVVKGIRFRRHQIVGDILPLAQYYSQAGADELVFYDITASSDGRAVDTGWISRIAEIIDIPFCVAGGIRSVAQAKAILNAGADKISINSPALEQPSLISRLADALGQQCVVVGIDSLQINQRYRVYQYTGAAEKTRETQLDTFTWARQVQQLGAGEIVLNCMNQDGVKRGFDIAQLKQLRQMIHLPIIASGGAGCPAHFAECLTQTQVDGTLAASVFHQKLIEIPQLKQFLRQQNIEVRLC